MKVKSEKHEKFKIATFGLKISADELFYEILLPRWFPGQYKDILMDF